MPSVFLPTTQNKISNCPRNPKHLRQTIEEDGKLWVVFNEGGDADVIAALHRLKSWFWDLRIVRPYTTVDQGHSSIQGENAWLFARHWYSTLVDSVSRPSSASRLSSRSLRVFRFPTGAENGTPSSTWGEWYLVVEAGTENKALASSLITDLTSASKTIDRAIRGGGLPAVERFYSEYGEAACFGTNITFNDMRRDFLRDARTRLRFKNCRAVMQCVHGGLFEIMSNVNCDPTSVWTRVRDSIQSINPNEG